MPQNIGNALKNNSVSVCLKCYGFGDLRICRENKLEGKNPEDECDRCMGTGIYIEGKQRDVEFISNMFKVFSNGKKDWREDREYVMGLLVMNPAVRIVDVGDDDPDTFIITFREHALLIKDGKISKFF